MRRLALLSMVVVLGMLMGTALANDTGSEKDQVMCGPNCLLYVCSKFGVKTDRAELVRLSAKDDRGTTLAGLYNAAVSKKLQAMAVKISVDELSTLKMPAITHLWGNHFVVTEGNGYARLKVTDPPQQTKFMSREEFSKLYSGFALLISDSRSLFPKTATTGPDIRFDEYTCVLGPVDAGEKVRHTITFRNVGNENLLVTGFHTSCPCLKATISQANVPPGGEAQLSTTFDTTDLGGMPRRFVYVDSNDPVSPHVTVDITARLNTPGVLMSSRDIRLGKIRYHQGASYTITARDPGDGLLSLGTPTSDSPFLTVAPADTEAAKLPGGEHKITVKLEPDAPLGVLQGKIAIPTNHRRESRVVIPVTAMIVGNTEALPDMLFLGRVRKGEIVSGMVNLINCAERPVAILKVESPWPYLSVVTAARVVGKKCALTARLGKGVPAGCHEGNVVVHTDDPDQPTITIPVYALVEE